MNSKKTEENYPPSGDSSHRRASSPKHRQGPGWHRVIWATIYIWAGLMLLGSIFFQSKHLIAETAKYLGATVLMALLVKGAVKNYHAREYDILFFRFSLVLFILYKVAMKIVQ